MVFYTNVCVKASLDRTPPLTVRMLRSPLLLHIPHASTRIPDDAGGDFVVDRDTLDAELLRLTDRFTDTLSGDGFPAAQTVAADVSRLVVGVERFADDAHEPCLEQFGRCVMIDAHSFPVTALPTQVDLSAPPEIGIGTDAMHTSPELALVVHTFFTDRGFRVGMNTPFAGTMVPNAYYGRDARVQSVMLEVRRDLYMDERTGDRLPGFADVQRVLTEFRAMLEAWVLARGSVG